MKSKYVLWMLLFWVIVVAALVMVRQARAGTNSWVPANWQPDGLPKNGVVMDIQDLHSRHMVQQNPSAVFQPTPVKNSEDVTETTILNVPPTSVTNPPTQAPTEAPTQPPATQAPTESPTQAPEATEKPKCNNGSGNGGEGCSPSENGNNDED